VGGYTSDYIYSLAEIFDVETEQWRRASNDFPVFVEQGAAAGFRDSFIVVGGYDDQQNEYLPTIFKYEPESESWTLFGHSLRIPRYDHTLIPVPDTIGNCYDQGKK